MARGVTQSATGQVLPRAGSCTETPFAEHLRLLSLRPNQKEIKYGNARSRFRRGFPVLRTDGYPGYWPSKMGKCLPRISSLPAPRYPSSLAARCRGGAGAPTPPPFGPHVDLTPPRHWRCVPPPMCHGLCLSVLATGVREGASRSFGVLGGLGGRSRRGVIAAARWRSSTWNRPARYAASRIGLGALTVRGPSRVGWVTLSAPVAGQFGSGQRPLQEVLVTVLTSAPTPPKKQTKTTR